MIQEFLDFLNCNQAALTVLFTALVAIATVVYAILTFRLVDETKKMREVQTEPKISVVVYPREEWINWLDLKIENIGQGPAYDLRFKIEPDFECYKGKFLSSLGFVKNGVRYLGPKEKIKFFLCSIVENFKERTERPFEVSVTYKNQNGKEFRDKFIIDFSEMEALTELGEPPLYKISKCLEKIESDVSAVASGFKKIKISVFTQEDLRAEEKEVKAHFKKGYKRAQEKLKELKEKKG